VYIIHGLHALPYIKEIPAREAASLGGLGSGYTCSWAHKYHHTVFEALAAAKYTAKI